MITERDYRILTVVTENKIKNRKLMRKQIMADRSNGQFSKVMNKLVNGSMLRAFRDSRVLGGKELVYEITDKGIEYLKQTNPNIVGTPRKSYAINHDLGLVSIREVMEQFPQVKDYCTETMLHCYQNYVENELYEPYTKTQSDAVLELRKIDQGEHVLGAIEHECSIKAPSRYHNLLFKYYTHKNIRFVFYIYTDEKIKNIICKVEKDLKPDGESKLFFAKYDDVINHNGILRFRSEREANFKRDCAWSGSGNFGEIIFGGPSLQVPEISENEASQKSANI
jgi:hypothetical protein